MKILVLLALVLGLSHAAFAQRTQFSINEAWQFKKGDYAQQAVFNKDDNTGWETVNIPHTWNVEDSIDKAIYYYRGPGWYRKQLHITPAMLEQNLYLHFEAAKQDAQVYINGKYVGKHEPGYTAFRFKINDYLNTHNLADNTVAVRVDNGYNPDIAPLGGDWTFFGGIYRDVYLVQTQPVHFDMEDYAADGVYLSTPSVSEDAAQLVVQARVRSDLDDTQDILWITELYDAEGNVVATQESPLSLDTGLIEPTHRFANIKQPKLWSPSNPYLYTVRSKLVDAQSKDVYDELSLPWGFRWYSFDAEDGFKLNGKKMKLIGASRHQDFAHLGNALTDNYHEADIALLKEMGANFLRVAHYPHDKAVMRACDRLGIMTAVEAPIVSRITQSEAFFENCKFQMREMIKQYYNHPSVIMWSYMNEVLLSTKLGKYRKGDTLSEENKSYLASVTELTEELEALTRKMDSERYTIIANVRWPEIHEYAKLTTIPKVVGWNIYSGWYGSRFDTMTNFLKDFHEQNPDKPVLITEFGAGSDPRIRSDDPKRFDFSVEWQNIYNDHYLNAVYDNDHVVGAAIWNFADFSSEPRQDAVPYINSKGVTTWDRRPKDSYYYYQARLSEDPVVRVAPALVERKIGVVGSTTNPTTQQVWVYSNLDEVQVLHNGNSVGTFAVDKGVAYIDIAFAQGKNTIEARGTGEAQAHSHRQIYHFERIPENLSELFSGADRKLAEIRVNVGAHFWYTDDSGQVWLKDQPYTPGGFGYEGGEVFTIWGGGRVGASKNIQLTGDDPLYQTQRVGLEAYKFDIPAGQYELSLGFAELLSGKERETLAFNLGADSEDKAVSPNRTFDITANDQLIWDGLNLAQQVGEEHAIQRKFMLNITGKDGLTLRFNPQQGETVLNNIRLKRID